MTCEELLQIASRIGRGLLESGAEAYRVENSVHYVIEAYDLGSCHVFSIPNYLHIDLTDQDGVTHSCMSRASSMKSVDLEKLNALNALCRSIAQECPATEEILRKRPAVFPSPSNTFLRSGFSRLRPVLGRKCAGQRCSSRNWLRGGCGHVRHGQAGYEPFL